MNISFSDEFFLMKLINGYHIFYFVKEVIGEGSCVKRNSDKTKLLKFCGGRIEDGPHVLGIPVSSKNNNP